MQNHQSGVVALRPFFADLELRATEEYIRAGRYFVDETIESLLLEWNGAIISMRESRLDPELLRSIVGVLGELGLRGIPLPTGAMAEMNAAAAEAFAPLDADVKRQLLSDLAERVASSISGITLH